MRQYILNKRGEPVPCADDLLWGTFMQSNERIVGKDRLCKVQVSTVFLGLDHSYMGTGPPILWETMIFGGGSEDYSCRCGGTIKDAQAMHARAIQYVLDNYNPDGTRKDA